MEKRFLDLNAFLRRRFGCRVQKITLDAGLTCPNRDGTRGTGGCLYCNARGSGTGALREGLSITKQLCLGKQSLAGRYKAKKFIAYFQSFSNTYAPVERLSRLYKEALAVEGVVGLSVGTRPDCVDGPILDLLQDLARERMVWVEYGLQSALDRTLLAINRGHDAACFQKAVAETQGRGVLVCAHVILGLPGETREDMLETARFLAGLPLDGVKIHLLYVAAGTGLEKLYREGRYQCLEQDRYVELVCDFLERLPPNVVIHRLTGDPHKGELVAPAWAFGQKAQTLAMIQDLMEKRDSWQGKRVEPKNFSPAPSPEQDRPPGPGPRRS